MKNKFLLILCILSLTVIGCQSNNTTYESTDFNENLSILTSNMFDESFDEINGGFSIQPKFPSPHYINYLLDNGNDFQFLMALKTLDNIILGGINDQLSGGFHAYSVDSQWKIPHFEKMLYDQGGLITSLSKAYSLTNSEQYKTALLSTINFVKKHMSSNSLYYSSIDAESEDVEGKYYVWTYNEIQNILTSEEFNLIEDYYSIAQEGNYLDERTNKVNGLNILYRDSESFIINSNNNSDNLLSSAKNKLRITRELRIQPGIDHKILTDWNAIYINSLFDAYKSLKDEALLNTAIESLTMLEKTLIIDENNSYYLYHNILDGNLGQLGFLDDYAYLLKLYLNGYSSTYDIKYIDKAIHLADVTINKFWDVDYNGFMFTEDKTSKIYKKKFIDSAYPTGYSILIKSLHELSLLTTDIKYNDYAQQSAKSISQVVNSSPFVSLNTVEYVTVSSTNSYEIVIVSGENNHDAIEYINLIESKNLKNTVIIVKNNSNADQLDQLLPFTRNYSSINGKTTVYICQNTICKLPIIDLDTLKTALDDLVK